MYIGVKEVKPANDYKLELTFENGEKKIFDMKPYLETGIFKALKDKELFNTVHISFDTLELGHLRTYFAPAATTHNSSYNQANNPNHFPKLIFCLFSQ